MDAAFVLFSFCGGAPAIGLIAKQNSLNFTGRAGIAANPGAIQGIGKTQMK
jgi:hypothetical protein